MSVKQAKLSWKDLPIGGIIPEAGTSTRYKTDGWRAFKPVVDTKKCTNCLICWIYCPDSAINRLEKSIEINYDFCKGCGICASECPVKAITMTEE